MLMRYDRGLVDVGPMLMSPFREACLLETWELGGFGIS